MVLLILLGLAIISGVFGRMGGAGKSGQWYQNILDSKWRDWGCSAVVVLATGIWFHWAGPWWAYGLMFLLHWGAFSLYWDDFFGYDNLWFSGFMVGLAGFPVLFIDCSSWGILAARTALIAVVWGSLNKYLPKNGIWVWRRDVVEEFSRYFVSL